MYFDYFTLAALADELLDTIVGGHIQDCIDVDETGIGLEIYAHRRRRYLYMSADQTAPRLHLVSEKLRRGLPRPAQLGLLMRRYLEGGIILRISQPAWERIIHIEVQGSQGTVEIIVEPMERRSNILLVQDGVILDCMRRVGPEENRVRLSLPAHNYTPPPAQTGKRNPFTLTLEDMVGFFRKADDTRSKSYQVLSRHLLGISPLLAREIVYCAAGDANQQVADGDPESLYRTVVKLLAPLSRREWQPGIVETDGGIEAFSMYPLTHIAGWHRTHTASEAVTAFYGAAVGDEAYAAAKVPVRKVIDEALARLQAKHASLERAMTEESERELLRQSGELILAYQYTLQRGQNELRASYHPDQPEMTIPLDPDLTPLENAQAYFSRYTKAKRALEGVPELIEQTRKEIDYLHQLQTDLELAAGWPDIEDVQLALQASGYWKGRKPKRTGGGPSAPLRIVTDDGFVIWVGRNSRQNEMVTFKRAAGEDLWLHARGVSGAHVVIKFDGRPIPEHVVEQAASLAAHYSARRADSKIPVDITKRKYVRKIKGGGQGMVTYRSEQTHMAAPRNEKSFEAR